MNDVLDRLECEPVPSSVRTARLFVVDKLQAWQCDHLVDSAALLTSELATNAVVHTGERYTVEVARHGAGVRVEVVDAAADLPNLLDPADGHNAFHGLSIVDSVASAWGSEQVPGGKVVWFELTAPRRASGAAAVMSGLSDLRSPDPDEAPPEGLVAAGAGKASDQHPPHQEVRIMARRAHVVEERERDVDERTPTVDDRDRDAFDDLRTRDDHVEPRRRRFGFMRWLLLVLAVIAIALIAFVALGGDIDVDTSGDLEVPAVDADVNLPDDLDPDTEEAPADANASG